MRAGLSIVLSCLLSATLAEAREVGPSTAAGVEDKDVHGGFVLDGSFVHNAGELQLNITNWGLIGSRPGDNSTYSTAPSAMWPAGSGIDYLFAAGLWVGALKNGVPLVSTGQYATELLPGADPRETIYRTSATDPAGGRYPFAPSADDDNDGRADEDPPDGYDNDGDGRIDEDFVGVGDQHFRLRMRDNLPLAEELWIEHEPLEIEVIQNSYQWSSPHLENTVAFEYDIRNIGSQTLENVVIGFFADPDIGLRNDPGLSIDDMIGFETRTITGRDGAPLSISVAYMYDCQDVFTSNPGYIGFFFINERNPPSPLAIQRFSFFAGNAPFESGGDPNNDAERYQIMTEGTTPPLPRDCTDGNDYRLLISFQPSFGFRLPPRARIRFQMGMAVAPTVDELVEAAGDLILTYYGDWFDRDGDPETGINGRELRICRQQFPPPFSIFDQFIDCAYPPAPDCNPFTQASPITAQDLDEDGCVWINGDCAFEQARGTACGVCTGDPSQPGYSACTGVLGREYNERWIADSPPPAPAMRIWETDNRVHLFWRSEHEALADPVSGLPLFEGYRLWRVDDWDRPLGTSIENGPETEDWLLISEFDQVSSFQQTQGDIVETFGLGANTGLEVVRYTPQILRPEHPVAQELVELVDLVETIVAENPQVTHQSRIRYLTDRGAVSEWGQRYPRLRDFDCCEAQIDTVLWDATGLDFYEYIDRTVANGFHYFYGITLTTLGYGDSDVPIGYGRAGNPRNNFRFAIPQSVAQTQEDRDRYGQNVFVVPNPATREALAEFGQLHPNQDDPTGVRVEFRNLPAARNLIKIYTVSGDHVATVQHDGRGGRGSAAWNLVSRNGQEVVSGIYLYSVESSGSFDRVIGRFVVVR